MKTEETRDKLYANSVNVLTQRKRKMLLPLLMAVLYWAATVGD